MGQQVARIDGGIDSLVDINQRSRDSRGNEPLRLIYRLDVLSSNSGLAGMKPSA